MQNNTIQPPYNEIFRKGPDIEVPREAVRCTSGCKPKIHAGTAVYSVGFLDMPGSVMRTERPREGGVESSTPALQTAFPSLKSPFCFSSFYSWHFGFVIFSCASGFVQVRDNIITSLLWNCTGFVWGDDQML